MKKLRKSSVWRTQKRDKHPHGHGHREEKEKAKLLITSFQPFSLIHPMANIHSNILFTFVTLYIITQKILCNILLAFPINYISPPKISTKIFSLERHGNVRRIQPQKKGCLPLLRSLLLSRICKKKKKKKHSYNFSLVKQKRY